MRHFLVLLVRGRGRGWEGCEEGVRGGREWIRGISEIAHTKHYPPCEFSESQRHQMGMKFLASCPMWRDWRRGGSLGDKSETLEASGAKNKEDL